MPVQPSDIGSLVGEYASRRIDRRQFLARAVGLGVSASAAGILIDALDSPAASAAARARTSKPPTTTLTYRPQDDIEDLDPAAWDSQDDEIVMYCIFEGLVTYKPGTWDVVNCLAEEFEPSSDKLRYHFKLKQGIEWQKGYGEVRASDVKFSYERIAGLTKPNIDSPYQGDWSALETVQVNGAYEGTIILKQPFAPLMHSTLPATSGLVIPEKAVEKLGKRFSTSPVGSGPFEFSSWVPNEHAILKRFDNYSGANSAYAGKTPWKTIQTDVIGSDDSAYAALETGSISFGYMGPELITEADHSSLKVYSRVTQSYYFLAMSVKDPQLKNLNLRKAIRRAIDVPGIISAAYSGKYERAYGIIPPSMSVGYWKDAPHYDQDLGEAKHLLSLSGLKDVSLKLACPNDEADSSAAEVIASNLGDIGIHVTLEPTDSATMDAIPGDGGGGPHRQLVYDMYTTEPDPYWSYIWWVCSQIGLWNWDDWCDPKFSSIVAKAEHTYDDAARDALYIEAAKMWDDEAAIAWICYPTYYFVAQPWADPVLRPDGIPILWATKG